ncbi:hypothetical protein [uncultured Winogradskyella sp.]|uniref:hypothetical protein n=1 Tax=uncultured Winogradskyella sp. TaxID=395353 RepID=UPI00263360BA|nr:hypothetical protein [uncultured Winogradskyella sp.]
MKKRFNSFYILFLCIAFNSLNAQQNTDENHPFYDRDSELMAHTDTIPDFRSKSNKLKLTGTVYKSDGVTPAKDVIIYIEQPDEDGNFDLRGNGKDRYVFHRSWVKTDENGRYTFYTFVPGNDRRYNQMSQIFPFIKEQSKPKVELQSLLFDTDPMLTKRCRKQLTNRGDIKRILKIKKEEHILVAQKNLVLPKQTTPMTK